MRYHDSSAAGLTGRSLFFGRGKNIKWNSTPFFDLQMLFWVFGCEDFHCGNGLRRAVFHWEAFCQTSKDRKNLTTRALQCYSFDAFSSSMPRWEDNVTLVGCGWHLFGDRLILTRVLWLSPNITMFCSTHKNWQDGWTPNAFGGHLIARKQLKRILLGLTYKCLICPNMSGIKPRLNRISREFYQKETINVPVNKQTYLLYSRGCHNPAP